MEYFKAVDVTWKNGNYIKFDLKLQEWLDVSGFVYEQPAGAYLNIKYL